MSMLTEQCAKLRKTAYEVECIEKGTIGMLTRDSLILADAAKQMREAADTIADLRLRLTDTCRNTDARAEAGGVWHSPRFVCSECGAVYVMSDYARFCPNCGRQVVE